jgi:myo-inositol-hexaphosphate 3-phosphohydrolase/phosphodiesterase/alkaline phosphatase D-like protein
MKTVANTSIRFAQFNASLNRNADGQLINDLSDPVIPDTRATGAANSPNRNQSLRIQQAKNAAEIIQRNHPDVLLINEFDFNTADPNKAVELFIENYLKVGQNGADPVDYKYFYIAPSNTGVPSELDLDNNGAVVSSLTDGIGDNGYGNDAFGFGNFPGQFGMVVLSKYEIDVDNIRTFQNFLWKDMPGNLLTNDPTIDNPDTLVNENLNGFYSAEEIAKLRLSSKSHWDVPIKVNGETIHALVSHPTPPVFDGTEDRNGKRNADEIRFWADYVSPDQGSYIYDDKGMEGGLSSGSSFVIMGDQNADPLDGDSYNNAVNQLLLNPNINTNFIPTSAGGPQQSVLQGQANSTQTGNPAFDTADFADSGTNPGNLRTDYVLPSADLTIANSGVFWPSNTDPMFAPVGVFDGSLPGGYPTSDHRLVFADIQIGATPVGQSAASASFLGQQTFATGFIPTGAAAQIDGVDVPLGGLSGVTYDAVNNQYYAIADDRSSNARFYTFTLDPVSNEVVFTNVVQLKDANGNPFAANSLDPEGIALSGNGTVFISSEGEANPSVGRVSNPFVKEFSLTTGQELRSLAVPAKFLPKVADTNSNGIVDAADTQTAGVRNNLAFESLTVSPDQRTLYTATENALLLDGDRASLATGSRSRIIQYNLVTGQPEKEYLYNTDAIAKSPNPSTGSSDNGLVDLLAIDNRGTFLALERSFSVGQGNTIKIYEVSLQGATDISSIDSLSSLSADQLEAIAPASKRLLLDLDSLGLPNTDGNHPTGTDNIEGIAFGPKLADGRQSIVLVSDNNFSSAQFTQVLTLSADFVPTVAPTVETRPALLDDDSQPFSQRADADDPAIYVNATDSAKSWVIASVKNGGLRVYDLAGNLVQTINPSSPDVRYNNVDVQYGFDLDGQKIDIAVASDRNNDKLAIFKINPDSTGGTFLEDITDRNARTIFQGAPFAEPFSPSSSSAYGLALYRSPVTDDYYTFVTRRETGDVAQLKLVDKGNGEIGYRLVRSFTVPSSATEGASAQTEGIVVDQETGFLYIGQEDVGIWKFNAEPNGGSKGTLIERVKAEGGDNLTNDVEGLSIYYGKNGTGYLLASSQGDNTFAAYTREGSNDFVGRFGVGSNGAIDSVQESDGAEVINVPLGPNFPFGVFVTQDGSNDPATLVDGENVSSNFKLVPWENIANGFSTPLDIDTSSYDPRDPNANSLLNGVASGDTDQTSTVLWTRSQFKGKVTFEYSTTADFSEIVGSKTVRVTNPLQPVKVNIRGLTPDTDYFYRATDAAGATATGKFSTAAAPGTHAGLRFGVSGDWRGEIAPYSAISNADDRDLKFFVELGDTIYADYGSPALKNPDGTEKEQATTLEDYRIKNSEVYSQRYGQNYLSDLRASTSIVATIDDHEVVNDFQGGEDLADASAANQALFGSTDGLVNDSPLYEKGLQAFQEYNPIRDRFYGETGDERTAGERKLYRATTYGSDAINIVLDARSFRDPGLTDIVNLNDQTQVGNFLAESFDPDRTFLGRAQVETLKRDLLKAQKDGVTWKFINLPEPIQNIGVVGASDRYEGYAAERTEILKFIDDNNIGNVVFISADIHGTLVNNLTYQTAPGQAQIATDAFEISTGSVAFDAPFGPTVAELAAGAGILTPEQQAFYDSLPVSNDADSIINDKDDFIKSIIDGGLAPLGYDPLGLDNNLAQADGSIKAKLLQGDYVATQTYGWTEFDVDPQTQKLTVTTYGIDPYTRAELEADPSSITSREPKIVSQFEVEPNSVTSTSKPPVVVLRGFASLPADTFAEGPPSGSAITGNTNGRTVPFPSQPIQGLSGVQIADDKSFWFLADNGYGAKGNSADFLLRLYRMDPSFQGLERKGDGSVKVLDFVQFSDPNNKVPFDIVNEGTSDRLLTGADFDLESFTITKDGTFWVGEEFGPYLLHFDRNGVLLDAPIATPNPVELKTLNGQDPIVIAHRGASGELPEHTLEAYRLAILRGADFIEPDLVSTKDGVLIVRHEPNLINTTDVASHPEFADRKRKMMVDGIEEEGFFASDFTLAEIKTLRAVMPQSYRDQVYNGLLEIPTFAEVIDLVKEVETETGKKIGIYPETKHPTYHDNLGLSLEEKLLAVLEEKDFTDPNRVFIQSFEVSNLKELNTLTDLPLVQLLDAYDVANDGTLLYESSNARPYDFTVAGDTRTYGDLQTSQGLQEISTYADGIGPWKRMIVSVKTVDNNKDGQPDDLNGDGSINDADKVTLAPTSLIDDAHEQGLLVHAYTFRNEDRFLASDYKNNPEAEFRQFIGLGIDGYFTDFPGTGDLVRDQITSNEVRSPQNPDVLAKPEFDTLNGNAPLVIGHRGASGERPEHTLESYKLAIAQGADFIEPDLVVTKDGVLIARHEPLLAVVVLNADGTIQRDSDGKPVINTTDTSTDVYLQEKFADRLTIKNLDGRNVAGWFAEDFTLAEIKELNAVERLPALRGTDFDNDGLKIPTLKEVIDLVKQVEAETGRKIGIYPETKHPTYFQQQGFNTSQLLVDTLKAEGFTDPSRIFIQSFEVGNLKSLKTAIMPTAGIDIPLVQLFGSSGQPYDFVVSGDTRTYTDLSTSTGLAEIATYAQGIGPNKQRVVPLLTVDRDNNGNPDDLNGDGSISDGDRVLGEPTTLIQDAHSAGLFVHLYTLRNDGFFLPSDYNGDPNAEFRQFIDLGADGFFTDFPGTGRSVLVNDYYAGTGYANPNTNLNTPYFSNSPTYFDPNQPYYGDLVVANLNRSQGFEGLAISRDKKTLYPLLEGTVFGDPAGSLRIYEFDIASQQYKGLVGSYQLESPSNAIGDFTVIDKNRYLVIERDNGQGETAEFKKIFKVDLSKKDTNGNVYKEEVVDLLNIQDPSDLNKDGSKTFTFPFVTIEDVVVLDDNTILVANDNNYPFSTGRSATEADNTEFIVLDLAKPLTSRPKVSSASDSDDLFAFAGETSSLEGSKERGFMDRGETAIAISASNNRIDLGNSDDIIALSNTDQVFGGAGNDELNAKNASGYLASGDAGNDIFFLGADGRALGGDGNDRFFAGSDGNNLLSGGAGVDQFWIANAEVPNAVNTISDFQVGRDMIGIQGANSLGISAATLTFEQIGADTLVGFADRPLAVLTGIRASSLNPGNTSQFIFA